MLLTQASWTLTQTQPLPAMFTIWHLRPLLLLRLQQGLGRPWLLPSGAEKSTVTPSGSRRVPVPLLRVGTKPLLYLFGQLLLSLAHRQQQPQPQSR
jgi:hypothetical protein